MASSTLPRDEETRTFRTRNVVCTKRRSRAEHHEMDHEMDTRCQHADAIGWCAAIAMVRVIEAAG